MSDIDYHGFVAKKSSLSDNTVVTETVTTHCCWNCYQILERSSTLPKNISDRESVDTDF
jgi:hypothetical protein